VTSADAPAACSTGPDHPAGPAAGSLHSDSVRKGRAGSPARPDPRGALATGLDGHARLLAFRRAEAWLADRQIGPIV